MKLDSKRIAIATLGAAWLISFIVALTRPEPGWFDYHHSYNEHYYASILRGEIDLVRLPPGYTLEASYPPFSFFSDVVALRLVSLTASVLLIAFIGTKLGTNQAFLVASIPWVVIWGSRAQTDMLAAALVWIGLIHSQSRKHSFLGGFLIGLSTFVKPTGLLAVTRSRLKFLAGVLLGCIPFGVWLWQGGYSSLGFHAEHGFPGENIEGNFFGLLAGLGGAWLLISKANWRSTSNRSIAVATITLGVFAFIKAPIAHQYYLLPCVIGIALLSDTSDSMRLWPIITANSVLSIFLTFWLGTALGTNVILEGLFSIIIAGCLYLAWPNPRRSAL